ncbi:hypothetical protein [Salinivibrio costicola]|uniref:hypothetical protein n=1 Tax=Salinivibrio costicola TaxID=51367 RepID=UPI000FE14372|nr:hypothetical protein [Salinivibrio costicola]
MRDIKQRARQWYMQQRRTELTQSQLKKNGSPLKPIKPLPPSTMQGLALMAHRSKPHQQYKS